MHNGLINEIIPVRGHREMRFGTAIRAALLMAGLTWAWGAHATVLLENGNSLTIGSGGIGVTLTVANCTINGGACAGSSQISQDGSYLGVIVLPVSPNTAISSTGDDLSFDLNISSTHTIGGVALSAVSSGFVGAGGSVDSVAFSSLNESTPKTLNFNSLTDLFSATFDVKASSGSFSSLTMDFSGVPEPATFGLFGMAIGLTIALVRRRRSNVALRGS